MYVIEVGNWILLQIIYDDQFIFKKNVTIKFKSGRKVTNVPGIAGEGIVKYADLKDFDAKVNMKIVIPDK